jgi:hypothetical protein
MLTFQIPKTSHDSDDSDEKDYFDVEYDSSSDDDQPMSSFLPQREQREESVDSDDDQPLSSFVKKHANVKHKPYPRNLQVTTLSVEGK